MYPKLRGLGRQLELEVVATIFIIAASSFLFLKLVEVREGETRAVDETILLALRDPANPSIPIGPPWLEVMFRDLTSLGSPSVLALVTVAAVGYLWLERERGTALFVVLAIAGGAALETLLKLDFARPRPELVSHLVDVNSFSFPSGHATMARKVTLPDVEADDLSFPGCLSAICAKQQLLPWRFRSQASAHRMPTANLLLRQRR